MSGNALKIIFKVREKKQKNFAILSLGREIVCGNHLLINEG